MSVTKHVLMLWVVAAVLFVVVTAAVRSYLAQDRRFPSALHGGDRVRVEFLRDTVIRPNVGDKWSDTLDAAAADVLRVHLGANVIGLIPIFDVLGAAEPQRHPRLEETFFAQVLHCGVNRDRQLQRHGRTGHDLVLRIIVAGSMGARLRQALDEPDAPSARSTSPSRSFQSRSWGCSSGPLP
jgi:hypothetical protein